MKKQVIAYLHSHWDREWYREFEVFRIRLLRVFDSVLTMLEENKIPCFYFDGQIAALEDYLEIRPEKRNLIKSLIYSKKLFIGPFYCLVDEFLTDRTCFEKNLEIGMKTAIEWGCTDFIGYLADTFGHSENVVDIMREFGIDKCIVWRGCGDFPAEFKWCGMDTVNLVRGYFQDVFSLKCPIEEKASILKKNLDLISEKSGEYMLLPIGADHLGIPEDIQDQINSINELLKEDYQITLGSPFDYFKNVIDRFENFEFNQELRDNSKTFTLQGCYSSRLDLKRYNVECSHRLDLASRFARFQGKDYNNLLEYAYKLLLQNQAHDSICGCSTDEVHKENVIRYKKILQIADTIIEELKTEGLFQGDKILNLSDKSYSGIVEFETSDKLDGVEYTGKSRRGFERDLLNDIHRIPVTEDYKEIKTCLAEVKSIDPDNVEFIMTTLEKSELEVADTFIKNEFISLKIEEGQAYINDVPFSIVDFVDLGDSYNFAPKVDDEGATFKILRSKAVLRGNFRSSLRIDYEGKWDIISVIVSLDKDSDYLRFELSWNNSQKNHLLEVCFTLPEPIETVYSEDMNTLIKREFKPDYDIRSNLPQEKGVEAKTNTAPMQRGLLIDETKNNIGVVTKGLTQYEVYKNNLYVPILRSTGVISNPLNPARSTPAGPPIETPDLQMIGENKAEFYVFFGSNNIFESVINKVYNYLIV
ncbi:MAG: hypothetical protein E7Z89_08485 [Cyanobacteria bacterium SIG28]|nr:hypothetical protein [Cyanobacteria bacterium SIG28]